MKSLVPLVCIVSAFATNSLTAQSDFDAYRLGTYNKALQPLQKEAKDAKANYYLGRVYLYGYGALRNTDLAMRYFVKSAELGFLPAMQMMAQYNLMHEKDPTEAVRWYKKAAALGDVNAQMFLAASYLYGYGVGRNIDTATHYFIDAAKSGNPIAQYALAEQFLGSKRGGNGRLGLIWLSKSATNENPKAMTKLGALYLEGKGVDKDEEKGLELLNKAAALNYYPALIELGNNALDAEHYEKAVDYYTKAANQNIPEAYLQLGNAYLKEKSPIYDAQKGFSWTVKAAQAGLVPAEKELARLYQKGIGVETNQELAKEWLAKAAKSEKQQPAQIEENVALWLSNGKTNELKKTNYEMKGILSAWSNPLALSENNYNAPPQMSALKPSEIFNSKYELVEPNEISIGDYYDALLDKHAFIPNSQWSYPVYPLNPQLESLERLTNVINVPAYLPVPYVDAQYADNAENEPAPSVMDGWTEGWQAYVNHMSLFNQLYFRAILGDSQSQFEIGQLFQYGIGVSKNLQSAMVFYQNAADQQHLAAEYNLGLLYLTNAKDANEYQIALNWLTDAAFKGNDKAQYVLAHLLTTGMTGPNGEQYIKPNTEQAKSMLYLSAANGFGQAEFELADSLTQQKTGELASQVIDHKNALIRTLYAKAGEQGVSPALVPWAYYNAMSKEPKLQAEAFRIANEEASAGNKQAALLLGLLYDRGLGVGASHENAMYWYQQAGDNLVSQFILGTYSIEGKGVVVDQDKGKALLQDSAKSRFSYASLNLTILKRQAKEPFVEDLKKAYAEGNSKAGIILADHYVSDANNKSDGENILEAKRIFTALASKGLEEAALKLGYMYDKGLGGEANANEAQHWYMESANAGNVKAQYLLGRLYQLGSLGEPDYVSAKSWYSKASHELPQASVALGFIAETVDDNYNQAMKDYQKAHEQKSRAGTYDLALIYEYGKGVPVDYAKAKQLLEDAADNGSSEAMNQLGSMYFYGLGIDKNESQALAMYKKAADLGNNSALYMLGLLSETGVATKLDLTDALNYYRTASGKGNEKATLALARMYQYGIGVTQDLKLSMRLYQKLVNNAYAQYQLANLYLANRQSSTIPVESMRLLTQARDNGSLQARLILERMQAKNQGKVSFIEPVQINTASVQDGSDAQRVYFDALNEWNHGDEVMSRMILQRLVNQHPNYMPAKRAYEQLNQEQAKQIYG